MTLYYYDKDGDVISPETWAELLNDPLYQIIKQEYTKNKQYFISTVWLGMDHDFRPIAVPNPKPIIFETIVFKHDPVTGQNTDMIEICRFPSEAQAILYHNERAKYYRNKDLYPVQQ